MEFTDLSYISAFFADFTQVSWHEILANPQIEIVTYQQSEP